MNRRQFNLKAGTVLLATQILRSGPASAATGSDLPPGGERGFLGGTFEFLEDPWGFGSRRFAAHGPVFQSSILGKKVVFLSGPDAMSAFLDEKNVSRSGAHPPHVGKLFGGRNINMMDGENHAPLKELSLAGFNRQALTDYVPELHDLVDSTLKRWASQEEFKGTEALKQLAIEAICLNVLGLSPCAQTDAIRTDYMTVTSGMTSVPLSLPGTRYTKAKKARKRLLAQLKAIIAERHQEPRSDAVSRILAAKTKTGRQITDEELLLELHHMVIAGYIVFALLAELIVQLHDKPALRDELRRELEESTEGGPLTADLLIHMDLMQAVVNEGKRTTPIVPSIFGVARREFQVDGYRIPQGWGVWMALGLCNSNADVFSEPHLFDPARFAPERAEQDAHPHAFMPQGSGPPQGHRCLGLEYSSMVCQVLLARLLTLAEWEIPDQDLSRRFDLLPPEHADGLRIRIKIRS